MSFRTIYLGLVVDDAPVAYGVADYAVSFCDREKAHLSVQLAVPVFDLPTGRILPLVHAVVDEVNGERLAKARAAQDHIETSARLAAVTVDCRIVQKPYADTRDVFVAAARMSDLVILCKPTALLSSEQGIIESVFFGSGRPVLVVPPDWTRGAVFRRIVIAWDGGAQAARAVGDAMPLLEKAEEVEIVCITPDAKKSVAGGDLAQHLARHCRVLKLTELQATFGDPGMTLRNHLSTVTPDLLVMGAYAHSRLFELVLGGVTDSMVGDATLPVFYSH
jgi:nucleotide-binding universal stress UspA family protein